MESLSSSLFQKSQLTCRASQDNLFPPFPYALKQGGGAGSGAGVGGGGVGGGGGGGSGGGGVDHRELEWESQCC